MNEPRTEDLDWMALRFALDELSPEVAAQFERRLAGSQPAREALAWAVELTAAMNVAQAEAQQVVTTPRSWRRVAVRLAAVAACAAVVIVGVGYRLFLPPTADDSQLNGAQLAVSWSEVRRELVPPVGNDDAMMLDVEWDVPPSVDDDASLEPPSWMLAALAATETDLPKSPDQEP